jgi:hypothetical protein
MPKIPNEDAVLNPEQIDQLTADLLGVKPPEDEAEIVRKVFEAAKKISPDSVRGNFIVIPPENAVFYEKLQKEFPDKTQDELMHILGGTLFQDRFGLTPEEDDNVISYEDIKNFKTAHEILAMREINDPLVEHASFSSKEFNGLLREIKHKFEKGKQKVDFFKKMSFDIRMIMNSDASLHEGWVKYNAKQKAQFAQNAEQHARQVAAAKAKDPVSVANLTNQLMFQFMEQYQDVDFMEYVAGMGGELGNVCVVLEKVVPPMDKGFPPISYMVEMNIKHVLQPDMMFDLAVSREYSNTYSARYELTGIGKEELAKAFERLLERLEEQITVNRGW